MSKVIVLGGGVAGLSAAHELVERGFQVEVYECRETIWGGKARSMDKPNSAVGNDKKNLPGEHGFRFFPGFYKHLPDTMRRIPLGGGRGVFDNLVAPTQVEMFQEQANPILLPLERPTTLEEWILAIREIIHAHTGVPADEAEFFFHQLLVILTTCEERRLAEYERIAWWKFIKADQMSEAYKKILGQGLTRSLVAMKATVASTRTVGDILIQLMLSSFTGRQTDRVLNGPTNDVWIGPWIQYLTGQRVSLTLNAEAKQIHFDGAAVTGVDVMVAGAMRTVVGDHYVFAVPKEVMAPLVTPVMARMAPSLAGLANLHTEWMNGIQFYLNCDVPLDQGHAIYLDSAWALTSISQHQFWQGIDLSQYGDGTVRGILSVDISDWFTPGDQVVRLPAHQCNEQQIKDEVWAQLKAHLNRPGNTVLDDANLVAWHLDPDITFPRNVPANDGNQEPLLVNLTCSWQYRPEAVVAGIPNLFLASDYVRTYTDLATMEGANEAARRAVNGVLDATGSAASRCDLWPLQEPDVFALLREYDRIRFKLRLPHGAFP
ncbi:MAG TPA: FAD-dependent oxidoreductase [Pirellulales bacterium]|nr:FAD-dependent oxidoreductase [Pirellulales bacterium]